MTCKSQLKLRCRVSAVPNLIATGLTKAWQKHVSDSDITLESCSLIQLVTHGIQLWCDARFKFQATIGLSLEIHWFFQFDTMITRCLNIKDSNKLLLCCSLRRPLILRVSIFNHVLELVTLQWLLLTDSVS